MHRDGWDLFHSAVDTDLLDRVRAGIVRTFGHQFRRHGIDASGVWDKDALFTSMCALFKKSPSTFFATARLAQCLPEIMAVSGSDGLIGALKSGGLSEPGFVLIPNIVFMSTSFYVEGGYNRRPPHQDWLSIQGSLDSVVAWIPLHDVSADEYPIEVWNGSHLEGLMQSERSSCGTKVIDPRLPDVAPNPLVMRYGDVGLMSSFVVHRTGEGPADSMRVALTLRYNNMAEPDFIERDYPMPSTMKISREAIPGGDPGPEKLREFFGQTGDGAKATRGNIVS